MSATPISANPLRDLAVEYLPRIDDAQRAMMLDRHVPDDVRVLVDELADRFTGWEEPNPSPDPYLVISLLSALLAGEKGLRAANEDDRRRRVRVALEQVRQVLRDAADEEPASESTPASEVVRFIVDTLTVPQPDVAEVLGVSVRTLQRWAKGDAVPEGYDEARLRMVARTLTHLRRVYTAPGVVRWFTRPHPTLDDRRPVDLLDDPVTAPELVRVAAQSRSTFAS